MQSLNNFIIENIGLAAIIVLILLLVTIMVMLLCRDKNGLKEFLLQSQGELAGRLTLLNESNRQEQSRIFDALNER